MAILDNEPGPESRSSSQISANIAEIDGAFYRVRLPTVPRVGELIDLYSFIDTKTGHEARHLYEVVNVVHQVYDVTQEHTEGHHFVTVYVKPSNSTLFRK